MNLNYRSCRTSIPRKRRGKHTHTHFKPHYNNRAIVHAFCWSRQRQQVCHFSSLLLLSDFRSVLTTLSSPPSFLLSQTLWQIWQKLSCLSSCSIRLQWVPEHSFSPGNDAADELARRGALLAPSAIPCSLSYLLYPLFSFLGLEAYCLIKIF